MHNIAPPPRNQKWNERLTRSGFFLGAVLLHLLLFLMVATLVIWRAPPPPPQDEFHTVSIQVPPPPPAPPPSSGAAAANPQMEPEPVVVPVVTPISVISNANNNFTVDTSKVLDQALNHLSQQAPAGTGLAAGTDGNLGNLSGTGGGYGETGTGTGFVGTLYDLKQTPDQKPTDIAENEAEIKGIDHRWQKSPETLNGLKVLRFFVKTWDMRLLDKYYKAPNPLYATQICVPPTPSKNAPIAFHVEGTVHPRRWNVVYHAKVISPDSGEFRFIGFADDFMVVRLDGQNVLDASYTGEELDSDADVKEDVGIGPENQPLKCGKWVHIDAGSPMNMLVLIGEGPGGFSGFLLMIQKRDDDSQVGDYPVFQLQQTIVPDLDPKFHFSKKTTVFQVSP